MHDRVDITPDMMEAVKNDIIKVLSRYMEIDNRSIKVDLEQGKDFMALISNVQVKRVYRHALIELMQRIPVIREESDNRVLLAKYRDWGGFCVMAIRLMLAATLRKYVQDYNAETGSGSGPRPGFHRPRSLPNNLEFRNRK